MTLLLGLGIIGSRSADQLSTAGQSLTTWNRTPKERCDFSQHLESTAAAAQRIVCYLKDETAVREVFERIAPHLEEKTTFINHATIDPGTTSWLADRCAELGCDFLDCPFTGSRDAAAGGNLVYYVAGDPEVLERERPFLEITSKAIVFLGAPPAASIVKITTNLVTASAVQALTEALEISRRHGVDPRSWHEAAQLNGCYAMVHGMKIPTLLEGDFTPHFSADNMLKDVNYALRLGAEAGVKPLAGSGACAGLSMVPEGHGQDDFSRVLGSTSDDDPGWNSSDTIKVSGPDATRFLNGQVSNDVTLANESSRLPACLLDAKGKLQLLVEIERYGEDYLVHAPRGLGDQLRARLDRYLIADEVELEDQECEGYELPWTETDRIEKGIPKWPNEIFPGLFPAEAGLDETAVSFTKGCYTGQEVVSRMKRAGKTNKHLVYLTLDKPLVPAQSRLLVDGKEAGWLTSVATTEDGREIALGYRLRKFEDIQQFDVASPASGETIAQATIR